MKKFLVIFSLFVLSITPVLASNWINISNDEKVFLDLDSITPYQAHYSFIRSMWVKSLNDGGKVWQNLENFHGEKIWYAERQMLIDCIKKEYALKSFLEYNLAGEPIYGSSHIVDDYKLKWDSIVPETVGNAAYYYACTKGD